MTFMMRSCREANFRPILRTPAVRGHMKAFSDALRVLDKDDRRGMRFDAILRSTETEDSQDDAPGSKPSVLKKVMLSGDVLAALMSRLNADEPRKYSIHSATATGAVCVLSRTAIPCDLVAISGVHFKAHTRSSGDSNLIFRHPALKGSHPGRVEQIFRHSRGSGANAEDETFLVVRRLATLDNEDVKLDPYRKFSPIGGSLYYNTYMDETFILRTQDVVSHFAKTAMDHLVVWRSLSHDDDSVEAVRFNKPCVHVRPLDRVSCRQLYRSVLL